MTEDQRDQRKEQKRSGVHLKVMHGNDSGYSEASRVNAAYINHLTNADALIAKKPSLRIGERLGDGGDNVRRNAIRVHHQRQRDLQRNRRSKLDGYRPVRVGVTAQRNRGGVDGGGVIPNVDGHYRSLQKGIETPTRARPPYPRGQGGNGFIVIAGNGASEGKHGKRRVAANLAGRLRISAAARRHR